MSESVFKYCPMCATALIEKDISHMRRPACPACNFIQFLSPKLVVVVVIQYMGKLLLGKRNIEPGRGLWNFCGGYVDLGETVQEAAIREVKEEANLDVQLENLIGIYSSGGGSHVIIAYQASILDNRIHHLTPQHEEVSELAFFAWEELPEFAFSVDEEIGKSSMASVCTQEASGGDQE